MELHQLRYLLRVAELGSIKAAARDLHVVPSAISRYPGIRLHLVEALAGHLKGMLRERRLDLAVLFQMDVRSGWSVIPILSETLFLVARRGFLPYPDGSSIHLRDLVSVPLILTSPLHGLRQLVDAAFRRVDLEPLVAMEVDGLSTLMSIVRQGGYATIQPGAAVVATGDAELCAYPRGRREKTGWSWRSAARNQCTCIVHWW